MSVFDRVFEIKPIKVVYEAVTDFLDDDCLTLSGALAYYTIFSLPPLLVILVTIAGYFVDPAALVQGAGPDEAKASSTVATQIEKIVGPGAADTVQDMIEASQSKDRGVLGTIFSVVLLLFGATGVFGQLQAALNRAWEVQPDPQSGGIMNFVTKRLLSLGMVVSLAFVLLVSLALSTVLTAVGDMVLGFLPSMASEFVTILIDNVVGLLVFGALFAAMFKVLPDAHIGWKDVWIGGTLTAVLFLIGKAVIGWYLANSDLNSTYGSAGGLIAVIAWVYYTSLIVLFGAELTQKYAEIYGSGIRPEEGAVRVVVQTEVIRKGEPGHEQGDGQANSRGDAHA